MTAPPLVQFSLPTAAGVVVNTNVIDVTLRWSQAVTGFVVGDVTITQTGTVTFTTALTGSGTDYTYRITISPTFAPTAFTLSVAQAAGAIVPSSGPSVYPYTLSYGTCAQCHAPCLCARILNAFLLEYARHPCCMSSTSDSDNRLQPGCLRRHDSSQRNHVHVHVLG